MTISLCGAGHYSSHPVFSILCHVFSQLVFLHASSPFILSLHLFFCRPLLLLPEASSLSDLAQMWMCSRLKQWPNHFWLLFSRKVSTSFTFRTVRHCCRFRNNFHNNIVHWTGKISVESEMAVGNIGKWRTMVSDSLKVIGYGTKVEEEENKKKNMKKKRRKKKKKEK